MNWIMGLSIMVSGPKKATEMVKEHKFGKTAASISVTGKTIKPQAKADSYMLMETFMKEIGKMTNLKAEVFMNIWMEQNM
jgi:hypothetical protein